MFGDGVVGLGVSFGFVCDGDFLVVVGGDVDV